MDLGMSRESMTSDFGKGSTLATLEMRVSSEVFCLVCNVIIVEHADHSWRSWLDGHSISLLFCSFYGVRVYVTVIYCNNNDMYIYIYRCIHSNPKKCRNTIYCYFRTGYYQLFLYLYIYIYMYIYIYIYTCKQIDR